MSEPTITERREPSGASGMPPADHDKEFQRLADQWRGETGHLSYLPQKYRHGAYQRILGMGERAVPLILRSLKEKGGWWFDALAALTNEDPAKDTAGFEGCREAWLKWGKKKGLVE
jgi:hypothetical protein